MADFRWNAISDVTRKASIVVEREAQKYFRSIFSAREIYGWHLSCSKASVRTSTPITGTFMAFTVTYIACNGCDQREEMAVKGRRKRAVEYGDNPCTLEKSDARVSVTSCISSCTSTYSGNGKSHRGSNFARCS